ncbi:MAG TPA: prolyl oligopeptidase family serine peptidase [Candidatus Aminicenantes bacterium]|nr:prolyl oligopeptidase family serine peptidase [Candidatus Aminicenantes bacterium]HRY66101.1 prolyl oligopeptidase family serine peptidase [Candidatus Aminicenantes bacterium]HRZ73015.1 prolyl oligopeptidase family serine peptidase [Candidatus Aminicenantes bacterium]
MQERMPRLALVLALILSVAPALAAQEAYKLPPREIIDIVDAPPTPMVSLSPAADVMALVEYESMPSIAYLAEPVLRIAGLRITPAYNSRQVLSFSTGLSLQDVKTGALRRVALPDGVKFTNLSWSPDGRTMALFRYVEGGVELWKVDVAAATARALTPAVVNAVLSAAEWAPDSRRLYVTLVPEGRGPAPVAPHVPVGPEVQVSGGRQAKAATYQDLLKSAFDETLFDYYAASQLAAVDTATGELRKIGPPGIFASVSASPDGTCLLVERLKRPYSYALPAYGFARADEVWDMDGRLVKLVADLPAEEDVPLNGVAKGPRNIDWMVHKPSTLVWTEALDEGDPKKDAPFRDRFMALDAPFSADAREILKLKERAAGLMYLAKPGRAMAVQTEWKRSWQTAFLVDLANPAAEPVTIWDMSSQDRYKNPGRPVTKRLGTGQTVILQDGDWIYLSGPGSSPRGDHPFLDRMNVKTLKVERLWQCQDPAYESFVGFAGDSRTRFITSYETKADPPNYCLYDLKTRKRTALTGFKDPAPQLTGIRKQRITYKRADGLELGGTLYLPPGYKEGTRLPVVIWAYPLEYDNAATAGQVRGSVNRFTFFRGTSHLFFVTQGYAVLDGAEMPVVGTPEQVNDTFVQQIVSNAEAAIRKLDEMGVGDPRRVGIGGHSYGAFMTANLLAHCDLFAAGIARSGAYNRTLTPFGFQSERRTLWEATDTYIKMSPFMFADKIKTPLLLIHGMADNNSGTFPIQTERLFAALKGFGATARFVYLPNESHGYSARESVLDVLAEMIEWFDMHVKNRK